MSRIRNRKLKDEKEAESKGSKSSKNLRIDGFDRLSNLKRGLFYRALIAAVLLCQLIYWYRFSGYEKASEFVLAQSNVKVQNTRMTVSCSSSYLDDVNKFSDCTPSSCGRGVLDNLISSSEADAMLNLAKRGLAFGGSDGGASILDLHSGALSKEKHFVNIYKTVDDPKKLFHADDLSTYKIIRIKIQETIAHFFNISSSSLYLTHPTFFSCLTSKNPSTVHDEYWHPHVDKETYKSFHYTSLLYLNNYGTDFTGGRFIFDEPDNSTVIVEPRQGRVSMFTSGKENVHHVERVKSGIRYAVTISFSCDPKHAIPDPSFK